VPKLLQTDINTYPEKPLRHSNRRNDSNFELVQHETSLKSDNPTALLWAFWLFGQPSFKSSFWYTPHHPSAVMANYFETGRLRFKTVCDECGYKHREGTTCGVFVPADFLGGRYDVRTKGGQRGSIGVCPVV
jgi:hypothetical protein